MGKKRRLSFEELIEKYRLIIGGGLLGLILIGGGVLLWRENYSKPDYEARIMNYESRIKDLESQITKIQETITNQSSISNVSNPQPVTEQGVAVGANQNTAKQTGKININTANEEQLISLPAIGPVTAKSILDYRAQHGSFKSINELDNVRGIGQKTIDKFRDQITI